MLAKDLYIRWNEDDGTNSLSVYDLKTWQCWSLVWFPKKYFRRVRPAYDTRFVMPHDRGPHVTNFLVRSPQAQRLARTIMEIVKNETKSFREGILDVDFDISECDVLMGALTQSTTPQEAINAMENVERYLSNYTPPLKRLGRSGWWIRCAKSSPDKMISLTLYDRTASKYWCIRWSELNHKMQFNFGRIRFHVPPDSYVNYQVNKNKPEVWKLAEAIMQTTTKYKQNNFFYMKSLSEYLLGRVFW